MVSEIEKKSIETTKCSQCKAPKGVRCVDRRYNTQEKPHATRVSDYMSQAQVYDQAYKKRGSGPGPLMQVKQEQVSSEGLLYTVWVSHIEKHPCFISVVKGVRGFDSYLISSMKSPPKSGEFLLSSTRGSFEDAAQQAANLLFRERVDRDLVSSSADASTLKMVRGPKIERGFPFSSETTLWSVEILGVERFILVSSVQGEKIGFLSNRRGDVPKNRKELYSSRNRESHKEVAWGSALALSKSLGVRLGSFQTKYSMLKTEEELRRILKSVAERANKERSNVDISFEEECKEIVKFFTRPKPKKSDILNLTEALIALIYLKYGNEDIDYLAKNSLLQFISSLLGENNPSFDDDMSSLPSLVKELSFKRLNAIPLTSFINHLTEYLFGALSTFGALSSLSSFKGVVEQGVVEQQEESIPPKFKNLWGICGKNPKDLPFFEGKIRLHKKDVAKLLSTAIENQSQNSKRWLSKYRPRENAYDWEKQLNLRWSVWAGPDDFHCDFILHAGTTEVWRSSKKEGIADYVWVGAFEPVLNSFMSFLDAQWNNALSRLPILVEKFQQDRIRDLERQQEMQRTRVPEYSPARSTWTQEWEDSQRNPAYNPRTDYYWTDEARTTRRRDRADDDRPSWVKSMDM